MKTIVLDPGGEEIEPGELAGAGVRDGRGETRGGDRDQRAETRGPALAEGSQRARSVVVQVADDLDRCPLGERRARTPGGRVEVLQQRVEHYGEPRELEPGTGEHVVGIVHAS